MTVTASIKYTAAAAVTIGLATGPLASDTNLLAGRESAAVDNTSNLYVDYIVGGFITTGTGPTTARQIEIWCAPSYDGTTYVGGLTGADANITLTTEKPLMALVAVIPTDATTAHKYEFGGISIASLFGGVCPPKFSFFVVHNTGVALNSTGGNHEIKVTPVNYTSV